VEWFRARCLEHYGTTYGVAAEVIMRAVENWFDQLSRPGSPAQQHQHLFTVNKAPRRRDVQHKLGLITAQIRDRTEIKATELVSLISNICGQHEGSADDRTVNRYIVLLMVGQNGVRIKPRDDGYFDILPDDSAIPKASKAAEAAKPPKGSKAAIPQVSTGPAGSIEPIVPADSNH